VVAGDVGQQVADVTAHCLIIVNTPDLDLLLQIGMLRTGLEVVTTDIGRDEDDG
jgi:hypothetical protein